MITVNKTIHMDCATSFFALRRLQQAVLEHDHPLRVMVLRGGPQSGEAK
jgi:hypothetical protein